MLKRMNGRSRWIPHNYNPADGLTKLKGAHLQPLLDMLKTNMYHLKTEEAQLEERKVQKELLGQAPRLKDSGKKSKNIVTFSNLQSQCHVPFRFSVFLTHHPSIIIAYPYNPLL